jgi:hypothetical protein
MKISHIHSQVLVLPEADPLANSPENPNAARPIVILRIGIEDGTRGLPSHSMAARPPAVLKPRSMISALWRSEKTRCAWKPSSRSYALPQAVRARRACSH